MIPPFPLRLYQRAIRLASPLFPLLLAARARRGREDPLRHKERRGLASAKLSGESLLWIHAVSLGEAHAALTLAPALRQKSPRARILLTTTTRTSAKRVQAILPPYMTHQYLPLDHPRYWRRFLDHWRPAAALLMESEIWPNMIGALKARAVPMALVNARLSPSSARRWRRIPKSAAFLFSSFDLVLAQNETIAEELTALGARAVRLVGNIKNDAPPLKADQAEVERWRSSLGARPVFLAASTHKGEEAILLETHRALARDAPNLLTIIAPRHPERGGLIAEMAREAKLSHLQRQKTRSLPTEETALYIADTVGELGLFYRLARIVFIGGSLAPRGGQNALEAAQLGSAILFGPHVFNFADLYADLEKNRAALKVSSAADLQESAAALLKDPARARSMSDKAKTRAKARQGAVGRTVRALAEKGFLP